MADSFQALKNLKLICQLGGGGPLAVELAEGIAEQKLIGTHFVTSERALWEVFGSTAAAKLQMLCKAFSLSYELGNVINDVAGKEVRIFRVIRQKLKNEVPNGITGKPS